MWHRNSINDLLQLPACLPTWLKWLLIRSFCSGQWVGTLASSMTCMAHALLAGAAMADNQPARTKPPCQRESIYGHNESVALLSHCLASYKQQRTLRRRITCRAGGGHLIRCDAILRSPVFVALLTVFIQPVCAMRTQMDSQEGITHELRCKQ